jgi:hypothetical protein
MNPFARSWAKMIDAKPKQQRATGSDRSPTCPTSATTSSGPTSRAARCRSRGRDPFAENAALPRRALHERLAGALEIVLGQPAERDCLARCDALAPLVARDIAPGID